MKTNNLFPITLAAALAVGGFIALETQAAGNGPAHRPFRGRLLERAKSKLDLTDEQITQIKAVLKSEKDTIKGLLSRLNEARTELREAVRSTGATEESVRAAAAKVATVEADVAVQRMKTHARISPILTDKQREKISQFQSRMDKVRHGATDRIGKRLAE